MTDAEIVDEIRQKLGLLAYELATIGQQDPSVPMTLLGRFAVECRQLVEQRNEP